MTARRHPRTTGEAFPRTAEYGCAVERYRRRRWGRVPAVVLALVLIALGFWLKR